MTRLTDERIASLARQYLGTCKRVFYTKWKDGIDIEYPTLEVEQFARAIEAELSKQEPVANKAHWFALVMNATAAIEDASNCLRDPDAKRAADGAAKHYRDAANALYTAPLPSAPDTVQVPPSANCWLNGGPCIGGRCDEPRFCAQNDTLAAAPKSTP